MVYGDGLPANLTLGGQSWNYTSGALDIVAHELTHGVTQFTSDLAYMNESGALNESFSDMMGVSAKFFYQAQRSGLPPPTYTLGADIIGPGDSGPAGIRSMADPALFGQPDHYSRKEPGCTNRCDLGDHGGVHTNSGISNQAFYLAIEGGVNRTSGMSVQGVGAGNREQIEKVFYRAFTFMLTANSTFSLARAATIQAAREQYGVGSTVDRAVTQAWTAVGVN
jgi:thermolysin